MSIFWYLCVYYTFTVILLHNIIDLSVSIYTHWAYLRLYIYSYSIVPRIRYVKVTQILQIMSEISQYLHGLHREW